MRRGKSNFSDSIVFPPGQSGLLLRTVVSPTVIFDSFNFPKLIDSKLFGDQKQFQSCLAWLDQDQGWKENEHFHRWTGAGGKNQNAP